jgi:hypothetical protein
MRHANENEPLSFVTIAAATARLLEKCKPDREKEPTDKDGRSEGDQRKAERGEVVVLKTAQRGI